MSQWQWLEMIRLWACLYWMDPVFVFEMPPIWQQTLPTPTRYQDEMWTIKKKNNLKNHSCHQEIPDIKIKVIVISKIMGFYLVKIVNDYCSCIWQLRLLAEDGGSPRKTATTTVDITVTRNLLPPVFNPSSYIQSIIENYPVGSEIVTVSATDSDPQVCLKMILKNDFIHVKFRVKMNMDSYRYQFKSGEVEQISFSLHSLGFASFCVDLWIIN